MDARIQKAAGQEEGVVGKHTFDVNNITLDRQGKARSTTGGDYYNGLGEEKGCW